LLVIAEGHRAGKIISRIRALAKKEPPQKDWLDINETIGEVIAMARSAVQRNRIPRQTQLANDLPLILGDRIQLQQVILNLLINAIEAMSEVSEDPGELWVSSQIFTKMAARGPGPLQTGEAEEEVLDARALAEAEGTHLLIAVRDSGPGLDPKGLDRQVCLPLMRRCTSVTDRYRKRRSRIWITSAWKPTLGRGSLIWTSQYRRGQGLILGASEMDTGSQDLSFAASPAGLQNLQNILMIEIIEAFEGRDTGVDLFTFPALFSFGRRKMS
jgi:hypothetical protein